MPKSVIGEVRQPIPAQPGRPQRNDYEYRRDGTVNLFVFLDAHRPWRKVTVTDQRTAYEFARYMRDLADVHLSEADTVRVVLDNLSTHSPAAFYEAFPPAEAGASCVASNSTTSAGKALQELLERHAARAGQTMKVRVPLTIFEAICQMVELGAGIAIIPEIAARRYRRESVCCPPVR